MKLMAANNSLGFWRHDRIDTAVKNGVDEVSLALQTDA
jgi:hypothetical protein